MNHYIKNLIVDISDFYKKFVLPSSNMDNLFMFKNLQNQLIQSIDIAKQKYLTKLAKIRVTHWPAPSVTGHC